MTFVRLSVVVFAGVLLVTGCGKSGSRQSRAAIPGPEGVEHRTDVFDAGSDLRERQASWARDGWSVAIISAPITRPDGSVVRKAELTRVH